MLRLLFLSKHLIMSLAFGIVFNIEGCIFCTIKGRNKWVPISSHCRFHVYRTVKLYFKNLIACNFFFVIIQSQMYQQERNKQAHDAHPSWISL